MPNYSLTEPQPWQYLHRQSLFIPSTCHNISINLLSINIIYEIYILCQFHTTVSNATVSFANEFSNEVFMLPTCSRSCRPDAATQFLKRSWLSLCCEVQPLSDWEKLIHVFEDHELIRLEETSIYLQVNTQAFSAKVTLRTKHHAASFRYIYIFVFLACWMETRQTGRKQEKRPYVNTASLRYISWTKTLLHSLSRRQHSWCEGRGYISLCFVLCSVNVCTFLHRDSL